MKIHILWVLYSYYHQNTVLYNTLVLGVPGGVPIFLGTSSTTRWRPGDFTIEAVVSYPVYRDQWCILCPHFECREGCVCVCGGVCVCVYQKLLDVVLKCVMIKTKSPFISLYYLQNVYYCKVFLRAHNWVPFDRSSQCSVTLNSNFAIRGGGHWPKKGVWDVRPWRPPFHASPVVRKGPISSKRVSSQDPLLRKVRNFSLYSLNFHPKFSSQAPKFGNFQLTSPQFGNFQFTSPQIGKFSVHNPPLFRGKYQFASPT